jgi:hypothetical protein
MTPRPVRTAAATARPSRREWGPSSTRARGPRGWSRHPRALSSRIRAGIAPEAAGWQAQRPARTMAVPSTCQAHREAAARAHRAPFGPVPDGYRGSRFGSTLGTRPVTGRPYSASNRCSSRSLSTPALDYVRSTMKTMPGRVTAMTATDYDAPHCSVSRSKTTVSKNSRPAGPRRSFRWQASMDSTPSKASSCPVRS